MKTYIKGRGFLATLILIFIVLVTAITLRHFIVIYFVGALFIALVVLKIVYLSSEKKHK